jgi:hypothetical protein
MTPVLPELRSALVDAAAAAAASPQPARRRRPRRGLVFAAAAAGAGAAVAAVLVTAGTPPPDDTAVTPPTPRGGAGFALFDRPAGPYDRLPPGNDPVYARHETRDVTIRRVALWGGGVGYVSRGGGRYCAWGDLGTHCAPAREVERRGLVTGDQSRIYAPPGRVAVAGIVPDRVLRVALTGLRKGGDVARVRVRDNAFRLTVPYVEGVAGYTLIEARDADQWSLATLPSRDGRLLREPLTRCPGPYSAGYDWRVSGAPCEAVGTYIRQHFEPHPAGYSIDAGGFACRVAQARDRSGPVLLARCTDGYRRFSFKFA